MFGGHSKRFSSWLMNDNFKLPNEIAATVGLVRECFCAGLPFQIFQDCIIVNNSPSFGDTSGNSARAREVHGLGWIRTNVNGNLNKFVGKILR